MVHVVAVDFRLTKQATFHVTATSFPTKWRLRRTVEIPFWWHFTTQIWLVCVIGCGAGKICFNQWEVLPSSDASSEYGISAVVSQMSFCWESTGGVAKCQVNCFLRLHWSGDCPGSGPQHMILVTRGLVWLSQWTMCSVHNYGKSTVTNLQKRCKTWNCRGRAGEVEREGNAYDCHYILRSFVVLSLWMLCTCVILSVLGAASPYLCWN